MNWRQDLKKIVRGELLFDVSMASLTSIGVGGPADAVLSPRDSEEIEDVLNFCRERGVEFYVLGKGTNVLVRDGGIRGLVLHMAYSTGDIKEVKTKRDKVTLQVSAATTLRYLLKYCIRRGIGGVEFLAGIPGTAGGALIMNAGAFGKSFGDITEALKIVRAGGTGEWLDAGHLGFDYRRASLPEKTVVTKVVLAARRTSPRKIKDRMRAIMWSRMKTQPRGKRTFGSAFLNPPGGYAGQLIEGAGLKGFRVGGAKVSEIHANFIMTEPGATATDVLKLMDHIRDAVEERYGVVLEPEVRIIGEDL